MFRQRGPSRPPLEEYDDQVCLFFLQNRYILLISLFLTVIISTLFPRKMSSTMSTERSTSTMTIMTMEQAELGKSP